LLQPEIDPWRVLAWIGLGFDDVHAEEFEKSYGRRALAVRDEALA